VIHPEWERAQALHPNKLENLSSPRLNAISDNFKEGIELRDELNVWVLNSQAG